MRTCAGFGAPDCKNTPVNGKTLCNTCSSRKKRQKQRETLLGVQNQYNDLLERYNSLVAEHTTLKLSYQRQFDTLLQEYQRLAKEHSELKQGNTTGEIAPAVETQQVPVPAHLQLKAEEESTQSSSATIIAGENPNVTACRLLFLSQPPQAGYLPQTFALPLVHPFSTAYATIPSLQHGINAEGASVAIPNPEFHFRPAIAPAHSHTHIVSADESEWVYLKSD